MSKLDTEVYTPRLSIEITEDQNRKLQKYLPHGTKKIIFHQIIDQLIELIEKHGAGTVLGTFIERQITLEQMLNLKVK